MFDHASHTRTRPMAEGCVWCGDVDLYTRLWAWRSPYSALLTHDGGEVLLRLVQRPPPRLLGVFRRDGTTRRKNVRNGIGYKCWSES